MCRGIRSSFGFLSMLCYAGPCSLFVVSFFVSASLAEAEFNMLDLSFCMRKSPADLPGWLRRGKSPPLRRKMTAAAAGSCHGPGCEPSVSEPASLAVPPRDLPIC
jgi:hypothetical protein